MFSFNVLNYLYEDESAGLGEVTSFIEEAVVMRDFDHQNVLSLLGLVVKDNKPYVILPLMEHGDLKTYISNRDLVSILSIDIKTFSQSDMVI